MAKVIVSSSPGLLVQSVVAASPVGVRAAEGVEPSSLDRPVKAAAAAAAVPMAEGQAAEVEFPSCAPLELAASASWTEGTWAETVTAPCLALAGVQPWPVLGLAGPVLGLAGTSRSEERRVGKECVQPCRSRWSPYH